MLPGPRAPPLDSPASAMKSDRLLLAALAVAPVLGWFLADGRLKIDLSDEGFLWYGTIALRRGLVPFRDFQSYDPGRYAWTAGWSFVLGESLVALRFACVLFQCAGLFAGLLAARRLSRNPGFLLCVALALCAWMGPRYKVFDPSLALASVAAGAWLLEKPSRARHFAVGVLGGAAAFFGRNHGLYHLAAFGALIAWSARGCGAGETARRVLFWTLGLALGYLPQLAMFALVPGYLDAFLASIGEILRHGTNLPVAAPWPWAIPAELQPWPRASLIAIGCFFVALPAFLALALARSLALGRAGLAAHPVLLAAACVAAPYAHHAFSRADVVHLSGAAPVLVIGLLALGGSFQGELARWRGLLAPALLLASLLATLLWTTTAIEVARVPGAFETVDVGGATMRVSRRDAAVLSGARKLAGELARPEEPVFFAPNQPGLYPFTGRLSPTRQIYFFYPATPEEDRRLREELESAGVRWAMIRDYALDGRDELRFVRTHPITAGYLREHFRPVPVESLPPDELVVRRLSPR
jgi:hypothetical protein